MAAFGFTVTTNVSVGSNSYASTRTYSLPGADQRTITVPAGAANFEVDLAVLVANMRVFFLSADRPVTVKTNSSGSPTQTLLVGQATVTISGSPTGGTFTVTITTPDGVSQTTAGVAYNASAATLQTAIQALSNVGTGNATVTGSAGGPYTISLSAAKSPFVAAASAAGLTGGTPAVAVINNGLVIAWDQLTGLANPITADVTKLFLTNADGATAAAVNIVSGVAA
jgi:hypothetical protein